MLFILGMATLFFTEFFRESFNEFVTFGKSHSLNIWCEISTGVRHPI